MARLTNIEEFFYIDEPPFSIIEEFAGLEPHRKSWLCECLFTKGFLSFEQSVELLWPHADPDDIKKLEKFLILLKETAH